MLNYIYWRLETKLISKLPPKHFVSLFSDCNPSRDSWDFLTAAGVTGRRVGRGGGSWSKFIRKLIDKQICLGCIYIFTRTRMSRIFCAQMMPPRDEQWKCIYRNEEMIRWRYSTKTRSKFSHSIRFCLLGEYTLSQLVSVFNKVIKYFWHNRDFSHFFHFKCECAQKRKILQWKKTLKKLKVV